MVAGPVGGGGEAILMLGQELWAVKRLATHLRKSDTSVAPTVTQNVVYK